MQYHSQQMSQLFYTGAQNYETTYATVSSKDMVML